MPQRLSLVVIARDEAARLPRLLASAAPWVDAMWVLDTGSTDDTVALAQAAGARVAHFSWCDDFAAARNAALAAAEADGGDWHLVLDADEWLIDGGEALQALRTQAPDFAGSIELHDEYDGGVAVQRLTRLLPRGTRYIGRVHEQPQLPLPARALAVRVGHDGYRDAALAAKRGRNAALLRAALAESPDDAYLWYQLGKDAAVYDDPAQAVAAFERCAALHPSAGGWWLDLMPRWLFALKQLGRHDEGMDLANTQLAACEGSPDFYFALGDLLLDAAATQPARAETLLPLIEHCWRRCLALGERPHLLGAVRGRGSFLAAHNLALVLDATERAAEATGLRQAHPMPHA